MSVPPAMGMSTSSSTNRPIVWMTASSTAAMTRVPTPAGASARRTPSPETSGSMIGEYPPGGAGGILRYVDVDTFVGQHQAEWDRLAQLAGRRRLSGAEADELVALYQQVATHLS